MSLLDVALENAARGWFVFPCWPKSKRPMTRNGWHDASTDEARIREWWTRTPNANVAIACNPSNLAVLDIDHGLNDETEWKAFAQCLADDYGAKTPTYVVRTGRRPEFGMQLYFSGTVPDVGLWKLGGCEGQVKSQGGYVMSAGSIHPDSGLAYEVLRDFAPAPVPEFVAALKSERSAGVADDGAPITEARNNRLTSIAGKLRNAGLSAAALEAALLQVNADRCSPPLSDTEVCRIAGNASKWKLPETNEVTLGGAAKSKTGDSVTSEHGGQDGAVTGQQSASAVTDWTQLFHSRDEAENAPPVTFAIDQFLQREGVTAIAAPVRNRKTLISLNVVHSLLTGEPLFGKFAVVNKPERVLYLVPESGLGPFTAKVRELGLLPFVGETFFYRTLSAEGELALTDPVLLPALKNAVVFLDTAIRFLSGDENSSQDIRAFAAVLFGLLKAGAEAIVILHHTPKETGDTMTLENALRGSGDIGAMLAACWGTRLQDPTKPYQSNSYLDNLKQRDFESKAFEVRAIEGTARLDYVESDGEVRLNSPSAFKANKDGKDDAAVALIKAHPRMSARELSELLKENDIPRGKDWVLRKMGALGLKGVATS